MKRLVEWINLLIIKNRKLKRWQRIVTVLAAIITFVTTYALILPAITVEKEAVEDVAGMYLEDASELVGNGEDVLEENAVVPTPYEIAADQADAATYTYEDDDIYAEPITSEDVEGSDYISDAEQPETVEDDAKTTPSAGTLTASGKDYTVKLSYDETSGVPEGARLEVAEIAQDSKEYKTYLEETKKAMGLTEEEALPDYAARFFDIKIMVGGEEFNPESGVTVEIAYTEPLAANPETEVSAVHFQDEASEPEVIDASATGVTKDGTVTVEFQAESFSVYGVIYTVDFHYTIDGREYVFSIKGGSYVSLQDIVVITGLYDQEPYSKGESDDVNDSGEGEDIEAVAKAEQFIKHVANVDFSNTEYVAVVHPGKDTTVGALKQSLGLECVYSEDVTEEEIAEIDAEAVNAGEWGIISLKPFESEETLTITMDNGDVYIVRVTDAQENPYGLGGKSFVVVNYRKTTTYDRIGNSWNGTYAEDTSRWVVHNNTPLLCSRK